MNNYEVLGVDRKANKEEITAAYQRKLKEYPENFEKQLEVCMARETLTNDYDRSCNDALEWMNQNPLTPPVAPPRFNAGYDQNVHHFHHYPDTSTSFLTGLFFWMIIPFGVAILSFMAALMTH